MKVTFLCSDSSHPVNEFLTNWIANAASGIEAEIVRSVDRAKGGNFLFLVSCSEFVSGKDRVRYDHCLVLHASDLPKGRGWSPHVWEIIGGADAIMLSLIEAADEIDTGAVWSKIEISVPKHLLWYEINDLLFEAEIEMINFALSNYNQISPKLQDLTKLAAPFPKRSPKDSEVDPNKSLSEQFDLIRVCDPGRYPAFFHMHGYRYALKIEKLDEEQD